MLHVRADKENGQETINKLRDLDLINREYKILNDGTYVYIPVNGFINRFSINQC